VLPVDFKGLKIGKRDWALGALGVLAKMNRIINEEMLQTGLAERFKGPGLESIREMVDRISIQTP
jgi:hypothetical protein